MLFDPSPQITALNFATSYIVKVFVNFTCNFLQEKKRAGFNHN